MNGEIKEILEQLYIVVNRPLPMLILAPEYTKILLDYITNLQQELEEYKDTETYSKRFLYKANKDRLNANLDLVKENERLEHENFCLREYLVINKKSIPNDLTKDKDFMEIIDMPTYEDYKSRIEKAINKVQYIIDIGFDYDGYNDLDNLKILVDELVDLARQTKNILNGRSDE